MITGNYVTEILFQVSPLEKRPRIRVLWIALAAAFVYVIASFGAQAQQLIVVDERVWASGGLGRLIGQRYPSSSTTQVLRIRAGSSAARQLERYLARQGGRKFRAIHILSHGAAGRLDLGRGPVDAASLERDRRLWSRIGAALQPGGEILLYGCSVAGTAAGRRFVRRLASVTGAGVAASTDVTGAASRSGDWDLEYTVGTVRTASLALPRWQGALQTVFYNTDPTGAWSFTGFTGPRWHAGCCGWTRTEGTRALLYANHRRDLAGTAYHALGTITGPGTYVVMVDIGRVNFARFPTVGGNGFATGGTSAAAIGTPAADQVAVTPTPAVGPGVVWSWTLTIAPGDDADHRAGRPPDRPDNRRVLHRAPHA